MKAVQFKKTGGPEVLEYVNLPDPAPGPGEVLVKATSFGVGKPDYLLRSGIYKWMPKLPAIIGNEMSGHIVSVGAGTDGFSVGQPVLVFGTGGGHHAEINAVSKDLVAILPESVDLDAAVCIPNYAIAWCLLKEVAHGAEDQTVYVNGASGGVGTAVVDLARALRMTVIAGTSSAEKCKFVREFGADHTIDYSSTSVAERVLDITNGRGVGLILDQLIGQKFTDNLNMLAPFGTIVSFNALDGLPDQETFAAMRMHLGKSPGVRCFSWHTFDQDVTTRQRILYEVIKRFEAGELNPAIHELIPLAEVRKAHELLDSRDLRGKIVLKPALVD